MVDVTPIRFPAKYSTVSKASNPTRVVLGPFTVVSKSFQQGTRNRDAGKALPESKFRKVSTISPTEQDYFLNNKLSVTIDDFSFLEHAKKEFASTPQSHFGNFANLPLRTRVPGPAPQVLGDTRDVIDEALDTFRLNILYTEAKIQNGTDRALIYVYLYIVECLKEIKPNMNKEQAARHLFAFETTTMFPLPGDVNFPMKDFFSPPDDGATIERFKQYLSQLRKETNQRLLDCVYLNSTDYPNKHWLMYARRRVLGRYSMRN